MGVDLEQIRKPLSAIIETQIDTPSGETELFFNIIHLSPFKVWRVQHAGYSKSPVEKEI